MSESYQFRVRCWVDTDMENMVVTVKGATREEADHILGCAVRRFPDGVLYGKGQLTVVSVDPLVIVHHYRTAGGEVELISPSLSHEQLLDILPESILRKRQLRPSVNGKAVA